MHTTFSKRLLAGFLSVIMVLSLITVSPMSEAKAETESLTLNLESLNLNKLATSVSKKIGSTYTVEDLGQVFKDNYSFTTLDSSFDEPIVTVSDADGELDPDDVIGFARDYTVSMSFKENEAGAAAKVKRVKLTYTDDNNKSSFKTLSITNGPDCFSFSYTFKAANGTISPDCVAHSMSFMKTVYGGDKKSDHSTLPGDESFKVSSIKWLEKEDQKDIGYYTYEDKGIIELVNTTSFSEFKNGKTYCMILTLSSCKGYKFAACAKKAGIYISETAGYGNAIEQSLQSATGKTWGFLAYTADLKDYDRITLYFDVTSKPNRTKITEMSYWAPKYEVALNDENTPYTTVSSVISAANLSKTFSVKDETGKTVTFDLEWRVKENSDSIPVGSANGAPLGVDDNFIELSGSKRLYASAGQKLYLTPILKETKHAKFENYDFTFLGVAGQPGAALTPSSPVEITFQEAGDARKTLPTPKVTWKDSAKKVKGTSVNKSTINIRSLKMDSTLNTGFVHTLQSGVYSDEIDADSYVEGIYAFQATIDMNYGASEKEVNKYMHESGKYFVYHNPKGVDQTIKDGDVDFEVDGNPVAGLPFLNEDAVTTISAESSDDNGTDSGLYVETKPDLGHNCYTGEFDIVEPSKTYSIDMYYFLGRSEDKIGDAIPSGWHAYLNGDEVSYKIGYAEYGSELWEKSGGETNGKYGYYILVTKTFEPTTTEIASKDDATAKEKKLYVNAPFPEVGQKASEVNISVTNSTSKYVTVGETKWEDEDGNELTGCFEDKKSYTATVTLTAKDGFRFGEDDASEVVLGDNEEQGYDFIESIEKDVDANTVTLTYSYESEKIEYPEVKGAEDITIQLEAGATYDDIMNALEDAKAKLNFVNDSSIEAELMADSDKGSFASQWDQLGYIKTYDETKRSIQKLTFFGAVDLSPYENDNFIYDEEAKFIITVKVGNCYILTLDANGGDISVPTTYEVPENATLGSVYEYVKGTVTRPGYVFEGFYTEAKKGKHVFLSEVTIDTDTIIYASWREVIIPKVTVSVKGSGKLGGAVLGISMSVPIGYIRPNKFQIRISTASKMKDAILLETHNVGLTVQLNKIFEKPEKYYYVQVRAATYDSTGTLIYGDWGTRLLVAIR